jgi:hypothetical protein
MAVVMVVVAILFFGFDRGHDDGLCSLFACSSSPSFVFALFALFGSACCCCGGLCLVVESLEEEEEEEEDVVVHEEEEEEDDASALLLLLLAEASCW